MIQTAELLSMSGLSERTTAPLPSKESQLVHRLLKGDTRLAVKKRAAKMPRITLSDIDVAKLALLAHGALSPLAGFMNQEDYESVLYDMRLSNNVVWSVPITLTADHKTAASLSIGQEVALCQNGRILAVLEINDKFPINKQHEAGLLYQTNSQNHLGVQQIYAQKEVALGGDIWVINVPTIQHPFYNIQFTPAQTRRMFARRGWRRVVGFTPTMPFLRTHEYIQKTALELVDGLFVLHTCNTHTPQSFSAESGVIGYQKVLQNYYPSQNVLLGVYPGFLQHAGPRETLFWALVHKNYGCTHFIVGDDAQKQNRLIFESFTREELGIIWLPFQKTYYCPQCDMIVSQKTCPHGEETAVSYTGAQLKAHLKNGTPFDPHIVRPEVAQLLAQK